MLEAWAHWRHTPWKAHLGYGKTILAQLMDGMPGTFCPHCHGSGRHQGHDCPQCSGLGRVKLDPGSTRLKINPAFLKATHQPEENPLFFEIDRIVAQKLPKQQQRVIMSEYVWHIREPDQKRRAKRLGMSYANFRFHLYAAHENFEQRLNGHRK